MFFRITSQATSAAAGTARVDNFVVNAEPVPEPAGLALIGLGGLALLGRRRGK